jgi:sugar lactone lactonase YvrE
MQEYDSKLNPRSKDTNGNGIPDASASQEKKTFTLPLTGSTGALYNISDVGFDSAGNIYLLSMPNTCSDPRTGGDADTNDYIYKYDPDLNLIASWIAVEDGVGYYAEAKSIVVDDIGGRIYVGYTNIRTSGIFTFDLATGQRLTPQSWGVKSIPGGYFATIKLDMDSEGKLHVLRFGNCEEEYRAGISVYDPQNQQLLLEWGEGASSEYDSLDKFHEIRDIAIQETGFALIAETGIWGWSRRDRIAQYDPQGNYLRAVSDYRDPNSGQLIALNSPMGIAIDKNENIFVIANGNYLYQFDSNFQPLNAWPISSENDSYLPPRDLQVDANGNVCITRNYYCESDEAYLGILERYTLTEVLPPQIPDPSPDRDGDGLFNEA